MEISGILSQKNRQKENPICSATADLAWGKPTLIFVQQKLFSKYTKTKQNKTEQQNKPFKFSTSLLRRVLAVSLIGLQCLIQVI